MVAEFKSHVLSRDEKGFMGIPFKRLLLAGVGGGLIYTLAKITVSDWSIPLAIAAATAFILLTAPQGGIPRWQRLLYRARGSLMLFAARHPESISGNATRLLELPADLVALDAGVIFAPPPMFTEADLTEWVTFAQAEDADHDDGLVFVDRPLEVK
jgi:hypothetical protein